MSKYLMIYLLCCQVAFAQKIQLPEDFPRMLTPAEQATKNTFDMSQVLKRYNELFESYRNDGKALGLTGRELDAYVASRYVGSSSLGGCGSRGGSGIRAPSGRCI